MEIVQTLILCELIATAYLMMVARGKLCSKGPAALLAIVLLALMYPGWQEFGANGLIASQIAVLTVLGWFLGLTRSGAPSSPGNAWRPAGDEISALVFVHGFQSLVGGSLIHHERQLHPDASWGMVFLTATAVGVPIWYLTSSLVAVAKGKGGRS
jgi:hypothetical protein